MLVSIITTTINSPDWIQYYFDNLRTNHIDKSKVQFIVVGDNKTDHKAWYNKECEYKTEYWDIESQDSYLHQFNMKEGIKAKLFPYNNMLRRNFGYLRAIELGSDIIITVDDDNLPITCDFVSDHLDSINNHNVYSLKCMNNIINHCEMLELNHSGIYSRGYPIEHMFEFNPLISNGKNNKKVMLNMGLWTNKPDIDATYNVMFTDLNSSRSYIVNNFAMDKDTYFSVNTQNTAIRGEATHIFHNEYMDTVKGFPLHRFDDIWGGLFTMKVIHANNHTATFGKPTVEHRRNSHNYAKDLNTEYLGMTVNSRIWNKVMNMDISKGDYICGYLEIASNISEINEFTPEINRYFHNLATTMEEWCNLVEKVK